MPVLQKTEEEETQIHFYEARITLIPKSDKDTEEKYKTILLINVERVFVKTHGNVYYGKEMHAF